MKQKYFLIAATVVLFFLIVFTWILGNRSKQLLIQPPPTQISNNNNSQLPFPTVSASQKNYGAFQDLVGILSNPTSQSTLPGTISISPVPSSAPLTTEQKAQQNYAAFNDLISIMSGQGTSKGAGTQQQSSFFPFSNVTLPPSKSKASVSGFNPVYYPQCGGPYDNDPMPNGCNLCAAGCGPTSVSMILSSYVNKQFDPPAVLKLYAQNGSPAGCQGTTIVDAQNILSQNGMKTTDVIYYVDSSNDEAITDMKSYIQSGWTLLTLVSYAKDWSHFYWVTNIDQNNNVWAYDPGDAKRPVPLNENTVQPPAKYMLAIGVKKN